MSAGRHWVDGKDTAVLDPEVRAFHYGDGLFETLRIRAGKVEFLDRHMQRLRAGGERLQLDVSDWDVLQKEAVDRAGSVDDGVLKIILSRAPGERGYGYRKGQGITRLMSLYPAPRWPQPYEQTGIAARVCSLRLSTQPRLAGIKHLNRLEQVLARGEWGNAFQEGLMLDGAGNLVEGTMSNVFIISNGTLVTPLLDQCGVAGVMRSVILDLVGETGLRTAVRTVSPTELQSCDAAFFCNSLIGIWPLASLEGGRVFEISAAVRKLQQALKTKDTQETGEWYAQ